MPLKKYDFRFIDIEYELYSIEKYIVTIDQQITILKQKEEEKAYEHLKKSGYENDEAERELMYQHLFELIEVTIPKYFWGSTLVTLWAIFESAVREIATEIQLQKKLCISLNDINGDVLNKVNKYYNHIVNMPIKTRSEEWQYIRMLYDLRNTIAHANGNLENIKNNNKIKKIKNWEKTESGIQIISGNIIFKSLFIKKIHRVVFNFLTNLTTQVKKKYPKSASSFKKNT